MGGLAQRSLVLDDHSSPGSIWKNIYFWLPVSLSPQVTQPWEGI